jgi:hypothetical protein
MSTETEINEPVADTLPDYSDPNRRATRAEILAARAWVNAFAADWDTTEDDERAADEECQHALAILIHARQTLDEETRANDDAAPVTVEWAAEIRHLDGRLNHGIVGDEEFAAFEAEAVNQHLASLNEPTRQMSGVEGARLVRRELRDLPDGSRLIGPWKPVESASEVV